MGRRRKGDTSKGSDFSSVKSASSDRFDNVSDPNLASSITPSIIFGIVVFGIYIRTLHPSIPGGDSGELIVSAHELGVAHPPGYPVFTLTAKLAMSVLPFSSPAYSVNLLNAFYSALAGTFLHYTIVRLTGCWGTGLVAMGVFSLSPLVWTWSVTAEVFGLNNLMVSILMLLTVLFEQSPADQCRLRVAYLGAFFSGFSLCNQHTVVIYVACIAVWVLWKLHQDRLLAVSPLTRLFLSFLLGLSPYLYLPFSSCLSSARWTWGDHRTISGLMKHLLRQEYGTFDLGKDSQGLGFVHGANAYISHLISGVGPAVPFFYTCGIVSALKRIYKKESQSPMLFFLMFSSYALFFAWRANLDIANPLFRGVVERFWMQSDLVVSMLFALGFYELLQLSRYFVSNESSMRGIALASGIAIVCVQLHRNFDECDQSNNYVVREFASTLLDKIPPNSLVLTKGDLPTNSMRYLHLCENVRPDLQLIDQEILTYEWSLPMLRHAYNKVSFPGDFWSKFNTHHPDGRTSFNFKTFLNTNNKRFSGIFACIGMQEHEDSWTKSYNVWPYGPCKKILPVDSTMNPQAWGRETGSFADDWHYAHDAFDARSWEKVANDEMWHAKIGAAFFMYQLGSQHEDKSLKSSLYLSAYKLYKKAIELNKKKGFPFFWHKNFALACERLLYLDHNVDKKKLLNEGISHFTTYSKLASDDSDMPNIIEAIKILEDRKSLMEKFQQVDDITSNL